jgi:hypothetical protein
MVQENLEKKYSNKCTYSPNLIERKMRILKRQEKNGKGIYHFRNQTSNCHRNRTKLISSES